MEPRPAEPRVPSASKDRVCAPGGPTPALSGRTGQKRLSLSCLNTFVHGTHEREALVVGSRLR